MQAVPAELCSSARDNHKWKWQRLQNNKSLTNLKSLDNFKSAGAANCQFFIFIHRDKAETELTDLLISPMLSQNESERVLITTNESDPGFKTINR